MTQEPATGKAYNRTANGDQWPVRKYYDRGTDLGMCRPPGIETGRAHVST